MVSNLFKTRLVLTLTFLSAFSLQLVGQCDPPEQTPTPVCQDAPLVCLLNACYETLNIPETGPDGFCGGNTSIQNPQYFQVIPTQPDIEIHIHVDDCDNGTSLQSALISDCPWDVNDVIDCDPGTPPGGTMILTGTGLVVGATYYLMLDGFSGAFCNYTITYTSGIYNPGFSEELQTAEAIPESVCAGYNSLTFVADPPIPLAHGYYWVLGWSGDTITSTLPTTTISVPTTVDPGIYEICVRAFSGCDTTDNDLCFEVEIYVLDPEERDPEIYCPEEFPFSWGSLTISGPGMYEQSYTSPEGCLFDSTWMVEVYPDVPLGIIDTVYCLPIGESSYYYEGEAYDNSGSYDLMYPGMGLNGCDSMAELNLELIGINAFVEVTCENGEFVLTAYPQDVVPFNADLDFAWYDGNIIVSDENPFYTLQDGAYDLEITVIGQMGQCTYFIETVTFSAETLQPDPPQLTNGDTLMCGQEGVFFYVVPEFDPLEYTWSAPFNVPVFQDGSETVEMDFSNSSGGQVCVFATNDCGAGEPTCFEVTIIPPPAASFTYEPLVCADSTTVITFTGNASVNAEVYWDFDNPSTITGSGYGPYTVSWGVPGNKTVSVQVIEPGCDTAFFSQVIAVSTLQAPVVNCSSTLSSVTFDWADVMGASGYLVSIDAGPAMPSAVSTWTVSGLSPGTMVNMTLTIVSAGPCPDIVIDAQCTAVDCPPPVVDITGQDSACLNNPTIIDLSVTVDGNPDNGIWAGPGIIDPMLGLFDPAIATAGQHQITYTTTASGCPFTEPYTITVFDSITADFMLDPVICITDQATLTYTGNASVSTASFDYNFGTAIVVSGSAAGPYQLRWAGAGSKTVRLQITENGCVSDVISQTTNVGATLNAPTINCTPNTSGIIFSWTVDPNAATHMVNTLVGPVGTPIGTDSLEFTGLNPGDPVMIEIVTVSAGPCPDRRDTLECIARDCPMPGITVKPVSDICLYPGTGTVALEVTVVGGNGTGTWSGNGVTDPVNGIFNPVTAGTGSHQVSYNYTDDGCNFVNSITIDVYDPPQAFISNSDLMITCLAGSIFLDGSGSSGGPLSYQWTTTNGVIAGSANTSMAEATAQGVYKLKVTNTVSGCVDSVSVTVTQDANIPTAIAGPDKTLSCDSLQFTLGGNSTTGTNIIYNWTTPNGNIVGATNGLRIQADATGTYNILVRDTSNGCQSTDQVLIGIDTVVAMITLTPGDTIDCNTPITTAQAMLSEPVSNYTLNWSTADGKIEGGTTGATINVSQGGTYTLTILSKLNGCMNSEDVVVEESSEIINAVDVSLMNIVCNGENNGALTVNSVTGGTGPFTYQWSGTSQSGTALTSLGPGIYTLTVSDANGCSYVESYQITEPDLVTLDLGPDRTVNVDDSVSIALNTNLTPGGTDAIVWSEYNGAACAGCTKFEFIAVSSATISAMISDTSGCVAEDSMRLRVLVPRIYYIPNVFSPNGDGLNDYFFITGKANLTTIVYLRIFDRWGNQLFESNGTSPGVANEGWDGKFDGKYMLPGVYAYIAEMDFEGIKETVTGEVTIIR